MWGFIHDPAGPLGAAVNREQLLPLTVSPQCWALQHACKPGSRPRSAAATHKSTADSLKWSLPKERPGSSRIPGTQARSGSAGALARSAGQAAKTIGTSPTVAKEIFAGSGSRPTSSQGRTGKAVASRPVRSGWAGPPDVRGGTSPGSTFSRSPTAPGLMSPAAAEVSKPSTPARRMWGGAGADRAHQEQVPCNWPTPSRSLQQQQQRAESKQQSMKANRALRERKNVEAAKTTTGPVRAVECDKRYQAELLEHWKKECEFEDVAGRVQRQMQAQFFDFLQDEHGEVKLNDHLRTYIPLHMADPDVAEAEQRRAQPDQDVQQVIEFNPRQANTVRQVLSLYSRISRPLGPLNLAQEREVMYRSTFCRFILDCDLVAIEHEPDKPPYHRSVRLFDTVSKLGKDGSQRYATLDHCVTLISTLLGQTNMPAQLLLQKFERDLEKAHETAKGLFRECQERAKLAADELELQSTEEAVMQRRMDFFGKHGSPPQSFHGSLNTWSNGLRIWMDAINQQCVPENAMERIEQSFAIENYMRDSVVEPGFLHIALRFSGLFRELFVSYCDEDRIRVTEEEGDGIVKTSVPHMSFAAFFRFCTDFTVYPAVACFGDIWNSYKFAECTMALGTESEPVHNTYKKGKKSSARMTMVLQPSRQCEMLKALQATAIKENDGSQDEDNDDDDDDEDDDEGSEQDDDDGSHMGSHLGSDSGSEKASVHPSKFSKKAEAKPSSGNYRQNSAGSSATFGRQTSAGQPEKLGNRRGSSKDLFTDREAEKPANRRKSSKEVLADREIEKLATRRKSSKELLADRDSMKNAGRKASKQNDGFPRQISVGSSATFGRQTSTGSTRRGSVGINGPSAQPTALAPPHSSHTRRRGSTDTSEAVAAAERLRQQMKKVDIVSDEGSQTKDSHSQHESDAAEESVAARLKPPSDFSWIWKPFAKMSRNELKGYALLRAIGDCCADHFMNVRGLFNACKLVEKNREGLATPAGVLQCFQLLRIYHEFHDESDIANFLPLADPWGEGLLDPAELEKAVSTQRENEARRWPADEQPGASGPKPPSRKGNLVGQGIQTTADPIGGSPAFSLGEEARRLSSESCEVDHKGDTLPTAFSPASFIEAVFLLVCKHMHASGVPIKSGASGGIKGSWLVSFLHHRFEQLKHEMPSKLCGELDRTQKLSVDGETRPGGAYYKPIVAALIDKNPSLFEKWLQSEEEFPAHEPWTNEATKTCSQCKRVRDKRGLGSVFCHACSCVDSQPLVENMLSLAIQRARFRRQEKELAKSRPTPTQNRERIASIISTPEEISMT